jgi:hypothetical protein
VTEYDGAQLGGWGAGLLIGFVLVGIIAVTVSVITLLASLIKDQVLDAVDGLDVTRSATRPLAELHRTNDLLQSILSGASTARRALGG